MTISHASELKSILLSALADMKEIVLDVGKVVDVDLSCLQILCSAHRSAMTQKKELRLPAPLPVVFKRAVEEAGYFRRAGCSLDRAETCLWLKAED